MFGVSPLKLLVKMYGQLLPNAETLIEHIEFQPLSLYDESCFTEDDLDAFRIKFSRYLRGIGHPFNLSEDIISPAMREEVVADKSYRARRFLKCATGSSTIPTDTDWKITVRRV
jgi:hypothetical protein